MTEHEDRETMLMVKAQLHCLMGQFRKCRKDLEKILRQHPDDVQAKALHARVVKRVEREGTKFYASCILACTFAAIAASWYIRASQAANILGDTRAETRGSRGSEQRMGQRTRLPPAMRAGRGPGRSGKYDFLFHPGARAEIR
jgi:hypothetical protein